MKILTELFRCATRITVIVLFAVATAAAQSMTVNDPGDRHDATPGDGICGDGVKCTLREAVEELHALNLPTHDREIRIQTGLSPIQLTLGSIRFSAKQWLVLGDTSLTVIDGAGNPWGVASIRIEDSAIVTLTWFHIRRSRGDGILVTSEAILGYWNTRLQLVVTESGLDRDDAAGIRVRGTSAEATILHAYIGIDRDGFTARSNPYGVIAESSGSAIVGDHHGQTVSIISGNQNEGLAARNGSLTLNYAHVGLDKTGYLAVSNGGNGISCDNSSLHLRYGYISGNNKCGVELTGPASSNSRLYGAVIGLNISGTEPSPNGEYGIKLHNGAHNNEIGSIQDSTCIISGNRLGGIRIDGIASDYNTIADCFIGLDPSGFRSIGNGSGPGILITNGASHNQIGDASVPNVTAISGNALAGVVIDSSGHDNSIVNCFIGTNAAGNGSSFNGTGIILQNGAHSNTIGGPTFAEANLISGNRADQFPFGAGLLIEGALTVGNTIIGNYIGTDASGTRALRNGSAGIVLGNGARLNQIGGCAPGEGNLISGNGSTSFVTGLGRGIHLFGRTTDSNLIVGNLIGTTADGRTPLPNRGHGIAAAGGAGRNSFGLKDLTCKNTIGFNDGFGIYITDSLTRANFLGYNDWLANDSGPIKLANGGHGSHLSPFVQSITPRLLIGEARSNDSIDFYRMEPIPGQAGSKLSWVSTHTVVSSQFSIVDPPFQAGDSIVAVGNSASGHSPFSNVVVVDQATATDPSDPLLPASVSLDQNYPNPFNPTTTIRFELPARDQVSLTVYNLLGQEIAALLDRANLSAGSHQIGFDAATVASGVYLYRLTTSSGQLSRSMVLLK